MSQNINPRNKAFATRQTMKEVVWDLESIERYNHNCFVWTCKIIYYVLPFVAGLTCGITGLSADTNHGPNTDIGDLNLKQWHRISGWTTVGVWTVIIITAWMTMMFARKSERVDNQRLEERSSTSARVFLWITFILTFIAAIWLCVVLAMYAAYVSKSKFYEDPSGDRLTIIKVAFVALVFYFAAVVALVLDFLFLRTAVWRMYMSDEEGWVRTVPNNYRTVAGSDYELGATRYAAPPEINYASSGGVVPGYPTSNFQQTAASLTNQNSAAMNKRPLATAMENQNRW